MQWYTEVTIPYVFVNEAYDLIESLLYITWCIWQAKITLQNNICMPDLLLIMKLVENIEQGVLKVYSSAVSVCLRAGNVTGERESVLVSKSTSYAPKTQHAGFPKEQKVYQEWVVSFLLQKSQWIGQESPCEEVHSTSLKTTTVAHMLPASI